MQMNVLMIFHEMEYVATSELLTFVYLLTVECHLLSYMDQISSAWRETVVT